MNILFCDMGSYTYQDILEYFTKEGIHTKTFYYHFVDKYQDEFYSYRLNKELKDNNYDFVFSVNFFPLIANACRDNNIKYISWGYDSPLEDGLEQYFGFDTNYIFLFDRLEVENYNRSGYKNVYYLPLAVNVDRVSKYLNSGVLTKAAYDKYSADVSLVGHIYDSPLDTLLYAADDYVKGFVESLLQTQLKIYGANFVENAINDEVLNRINNSFKSIGQTGISLNKRGLAYAINSKITQIERSFLLTELAESYDVKLYTTQNISLGEKVKNMGPVGYFDKMLLAFKCSKLNLCPTLKSIKSGIPLRALDILSCGAVLFSNYQPELAEWFEDGKDVIMYSSIEEAISKADYYLKHSDELEAISRAGLEKVSELFTYSARLNQIFEAVKLN